MLNRIYRVVLAVAMVFAIAPYGKLGGHWVLWLRERVGPLRSMLRLPVY